MIALRGLLGVTESVAANAASTFAYLVTLLPTAIVQVENEMPGAIEEQVDGIEAIKNTAESAPANPNPTTWGEAFANAALKSDEAMGSQ